MHVYMVFSRWWRVQKVTPLRRSKPCVVQTIENLIWLHLDWMVFYELSLRGKRTAPESGPWTLIDVRLQFVGQNAKPTSPVFNGQQREAFDTKTTKTTSAQAAQARR
jgi:hypothetical protein